MPEVGVSLALKRPGKLLHTEKEGKMKRKSKKRVRRIRVVKEDTSIPQKESRIPPSLQLFIEVSMLYIFCIYAPDIFAITLRLIEEEWETVVYLPITIICLFPRISDTRFCSNDYDSSATIDEASSMPPSVQEISATSFLNALAPDGHISDAGIVVILSLIMAIIRVGLVRYLVPEYNSPQRLEALVRCKSMNLLSRNYPGNVTPRTSFTRETIQDLPRDIFAMPMLDDSDAEEETAPKNGSILRPPKRASTKATSGAAAPTSSTTDDDWGFNMDQSDRSSEEDQIGETRLAPAVSSGLMRQSSAQSLQALLRQAQPVIPMPIARSNSFTGRNKVSDRLFAAPKYATAVFRLVYCTFSIAIAVKYFSDAEFWPGAVGGSGQTKHFWDLSSLGFGSALIESDFDQRNAVLRNYFLLQGSYHIHSAAFHIFTSLLLWFVSAKSQEREEDSLPKYLGVIPKSILTPDNLWSFVQHSLAVGLIFCAYLFSSLRRLFAVAMFAFDVSSWFLHLLQMGINAPPGKRIGVRVSPSWVSTVHKGLVIPSFCYSRFYIFPFILGYSALVESGDWLTQLERVSVHGVAQGIRWFFACSLSLVTVMNMVYARRLHAHVSQAIRRQKRAAE